MSTIIQDTPAVCFEPCSSYHDDHEHDGFCAGCGWASDDHPDEGLATAA